MPEGDKGFGGVLKTVFGNPGYTVTTLLESEKAVYLLQIMAPLAFFAWRRPIGLLCSAARLLLHAAGDQVPAADRDQLPVHRVLDQLPVHRRGGEPGAGSSASSATPRRRPTRRWPVPRARQPARLDGRDGGGDAGDLVPDGADLPAEHRVGRVLAVPRRHQPGRTRRATPTCTSLIKQIPGRRQRGGVRDAGRPDLQPEERLHPAYRHLRRRLHPDSVADGRRRTRTWSSTPCGPGLTGCRPKRASSFCFAAVRPAQTPPMLSCVESAR